MKDYTGRNVGEPKGKLSTHAKVGITLLVCSAFLLLCNVFNFLPFLRSFILGSIGLSAYPILLVTALIGGILLGKKRYSFAKRYVFSLIGLFLTLVCVLQLILTNVTSVGFGEYLSTTYQAKNTPGGVVIGLFAYALSAGVNLAGAYIVLGLIAVVCVALMVDHFLRMREYRNMNARTMSFPLREIETARMSPERVTAGPIAEEKEGIKETSKPQEEHPLSAKDRLIAKLKAKADASITLNARTDKQASVKSNVYDPLGINTAQGVTIGNDEMAEKIFGKDFIASVKQTSRAANSVNTSAPQEAPKSYNINDLINKNRQSAQNAFGTSNLNKSGRPAQFVHEEEEEVTPRNVRANPSQEQTIKPNNNLRPNRGNDIFELSETDLSEIIAPDPQQTEPAPALSLDRRNRGINLNNAGLNPKQTREKQLKIPQVEPTDRPVSKYARPSPYIRPPIDMLTTQSTKPQNDTKDYQVKATILENTLDSFKIPAKVMGITHGPAVTRYEIQMPAGIPVKRVSQHSDDIAMMMESNGGVRIEAPIPGKNLVGIEIPNEQVATIGLKDIVDSPEFINSKAPLTFALGKDIAGAIKVCDLNSMPHLLVAGTTGSGKSVCLNVILISFLYKLGPDDLKLILVDPKRVEFTSYNGLPHLLTPNAINDPKQALNALDWAISEMDDRYNLFSKMRVRDFKEYNSLEAVYKGQEPKLPRIVIVIDELAELMLIAKKDLEDKIMRLAQLARAAGIHLIIATQRPSVDVITGTIKANLPSRIAFAVNNFADSKTILDQGGADKLLGRGDMLYAPQNLPEPIRIQCPFIDNGEVINIVEFIKAHNVGNFDEELTKKILNGNGDNTDNAGGGDDNAGSEFDPLLPVALKEFIKSGNASISAIQRRHSVGFARAARIVDQMERSGFISPSDGTNKNREVRITEEKYNELFGTDE